MPGSGVYIMQNQLDDALRHNKSGVQLAKKLMESFWDKATLAKSTQTAKSKLNYQQLNPNIMEAIESMHSSDLSFSLSSLSLSLISFSLSSLSFSLSAAWHPTGLSN